MEKQNNIERALALINILYERHYINNATYKNIQKKYSLKIKRTVA